MKSTPNAAFRFSPARLKSNAFLVGAFILTMTGLISRVIGFFYRIFLSHLFGEEGMGIYQLIAPVMAFVHSLTASGLQTAVSKYVAGEPSTGDYRNSFRIVLTGFALSVTLSLLCCVAVYRQAEWIAAALLLEPRCAPLLRILALSFPFGAIHSMVCGYFYGIKSTKIPAATQLIEQCVRVGSVFLLFHLAHTGGRKLTIAAAVTGLVVGEAASMLISLYAVYHRFYRTALPASFHQRKLPEKLCSLVSAPLRHTERFLKTSARLLTLSIPLSLSRIVVNLLQSVEAVYIPQRLRVYGLDTSRSLQVYGVLTGMALPLILFPSALISSVCVLLLPVVSEAQATGNKAAVKRAKDRTVFCCSLFGAACTAIFLLFGDLAGRLLFHSALAGSFIRTLSFICPFLYLSSTLSSILHGLGKTGVTFALNVLALSIRLAFVFLLVPVFGISGYLWGLLCSELVITFLEFAAAEHFIRRL